MSPATNYFSTILIVFSSISFRQIGRRTGRAIAAFVGPRAAEETVVGSQLNVFNQMTTNDGNVRRTERKLKFKMQYERVAGRVTHIFAVEQSAVGRARGECVFLRRFRFEWKLSDG